MKHMKKADDDGPNEENNKKADEFRNNKSKREAIKLMRERIQQNKMNNYIKRLNDMDINIMKPLVMIEINSMVNEYKI